MLEHPSGYREVRYPKQDAAKEQVGAELSRPLPAPKPELMVNREVLAEVGAGATAGV